MKVTFFLTFLKVLYINLAALYKNCKNALWFVLYFFLLKFKGVTALKAFSFFDWHHNTIYFSGEYSGTKVFLKCEVGFQKYLVNEYTIYNVLAKDPERIFFLPKVINAFHLPFGFCIAYKFLKARNLAEYLKDSKGFKNEESSNELIVNQLLNIIDHLYKADIIHRDIRPPNIFVDNGKLILFDFSFSILLNNPKQPFFDISIEKALGEHYKPEELKWDDAYSLLIMLEENDFHLSKGALSEIKERINRLTYSR
jgi:serine/threonine protein kinase